MPDLRRRGWSFPGPDAFEPVAMLVIALIQVDLVRANHAVKNLRVARHKRLQRNRLSSRIAGRDFNIAGDKDPAFGSIELDTVWEVAADVHGDAVGIDGMGEKLTVDIPQSA